MEAEAGDAAGGGVFGGEVPDEEADEGEGADEDGDVHVEGRGNFLSGKDQIPKGQKFTKAATE